jgi:hypothetical protein
MRETGLVRAIVTDHAVLRYLERRHGLDVDFFRDHIASLCANGVRYGAFSVVTEEVKFVLVDGKVVTTLQHDQIAKPARYIRT